MKNIKRFFARVLMNWEDWFKPLFDLWFAGLLVSLYLFVQKIIGWQGEQLEWATWFFAFIVLLILFLLIIMGKFNPNLLFKFLFSFPFYIFILSQWQFTYAIILFFTVSVILWLGRSYVDGNKEIQWQNIGNVLYYFVLFIIASKMIYWSDFLSFIWNLSHKELLLVIAIFISVIIILFVSITLMAFSTRMINNQKIQNIRNIFRGFGMFLVLIGVILNEYVLTILFSEDRILETSNRIIIWVFDGILFGLGLTILLVNLELLQRYLKVVLTKLEPLKHYLSWVLIKKYWWVIPGILFFLEAFNTTGFFGKIGGGAFAHWQPFVGPVEMMQQGGYLLWDIPSQYGFFRIIAIYLVPVHNAWQKMYLLNGVMQLVYSLLIFKVIWLKRGLIWYVISIAFTLALVFFMTAHPPNMINIAQVPSGGSIRFFWMILLMYVIAYSRNKDLRTQVFIILPIWIIGFLWSVESAVYVTAIMGPFVLYHFMHGNNKLNERIKILLVFPLGLLAVVLSISVFYLWRLGNVPDYWAFFEYVFYAKGGSYFAEPINLQGPMWVLVIIISWMLNQTQNNKDKYFLFCVISIISTTWIALPYWVAHSLEVVILKLMVPVFFGLFIVLSLLDEKSRTKQAFHFSPIFIVIFVMTFGTPQTAKHIYDTITHQDYKLENTIDEEVDDMHQIFTMIAPGDIPVTYIDPGRYMFLLKTKQYRDLKTKEIVSLNNKIWLPLYPANLFWEFMPEQRKIEYINRWLLRHPVSKGWVVNANDQAYYWNHSHSIYQKALKKALSGKFKITKKVEYGDLKAVLYERK